MKEEERGVTGPNRTDTGARAALLAAREALAGVSGSPDGGACAGVLREIDAALARIHGAAPSGAVTDLLSIVCHDLKEPLASIVMGAGYLERVLPDGDPSAPVRRVVRAILRSSERMNRVVSDMHDLGKLEAGRMTLERQPHTIDSLLRAAAEPLMAAAKALGLDVGVEVEGGEAVATCDRARVLQMIQKLVDNALKWTPAGGRVTLGASRHGDRARLFVSDTGRGVPDARKPTVFDRATNAAAARREGPGLGLAIVRELSVLHGGDVGVEDNGGGAGATFWFTLPLG